MSCKWKNNVMWRWTMKIWKFLLSVFIIRSFVRYKLFLHYKYINYRLHDIARLIFILYCLASKFKIIIDTIFIYSFRYNIKIEVSRILSCLENNIF